MIKDFVIAKLKYIITAVVLGISLVSVNELLTTVILGLTAIYWIQINVSKYRENRKKG